MSTIDRKEMLNELYDSALYTGGEVLIGKGTRKIFKEPLGTPTRLVDILKLSVAMSGGLMLTKFMQSKGYLPVDPFDGKKSKKLVYLK